MRNRYFSGLQPVLHSVALRKGCQLDCWTGTVEDEAL